MELYRIDSIRTNNFSDPDMMSKIGGMWEKAYQNFDLKNETMFAIYDDYVSDYKGDYRLSLYTTKILDSEKIELDLEGMTTYHCDSREDLPKVWKEIWEDEEQNKLKRSYLKDLERYHADGSVTLYLS
ncbi:transcriptional regulator [Facklamia sp. DSM 111018]|uniref:Transcriptional regulator n=1 Tax=Facklamia lactis TaxID=2749967 RepID=A0ABS0LT63_9LACT|nr:hypothetical protein [Facklamia lactis]MBG9987314.1 transcriptional regulator [Facklamia lactis]